MKSTKKLTVSALYIAMFIVSIVALPITAIEIYILELFLDFFALWWIILVGLKQVSAMPPFRNERIFFRFSPTVEDLMTFHRSQSPV